MTTAFRGDEPLRSHLRKVEQQCREVGAGSTTVRQRYWSNLAIAVEVCGNQGQKRSALQNDVEPFC